MPIPWSKKEGLKATCAVLIFALRLPPEHRWVWNTVGPDTSLVTSGLVKLCSLSSTWKPPFVPKATFPLIPGHDRKLQLGGQRCVTRASV